MSRPVPKPQWPGLLELLGEPVREDLGTHCFDREYQLDGKTYIVSYEYEFDEPLDISVRD